MGLCPERSDFGAAFTIDLCGRSGIRGVVPCVGNVMVEAHVTVEESPERIREVADENETRCPVDSLVKDADVCIETVLLRGTPARCRTTRQLEGNSR